MESGQPKRERIKSWKIYLGFALASLMFAGAGMELLQVLARENDIYGVAIFTFFLLIGGYCIGSYYDTKD